MPLQSLYLCPHGMQIIPHLENPYNKAFKSLHKGYQYLIADIQETKPDNVILFSPHNMSLEHDFIIPSHNKYRGHLPLLKKSNIDGEEIYSTLIFNGDKGLSQKLIKILLKHQISCKDVIFGSSEFPFPLAWAELVPLYYLLQQSQCHIPITLVSLPRERLDIEKNYTRFFKTGKVFANFLHKTSKNISVIMSADLAHTHSKAGPYGFHETSTQFDTAVLQWIENPTKTTLIDSLIPLSSTALVCGIAQICIMQEIIDEYQKLVPTMEIQSKFLQYAAPTYFGMALALFSPTPQ